MDRKTIPLNHGWFYDCDFMKGKLGEGNFAALEKVTLPHSNKLFPWGCVDNKAYQLVSLYKRRLDLSEAKEEQRVFVDFEGVMLAAAVYLNGKQIGGHKGGYTPFSIELTEHYDRHGENILDVVVDSTERKDIPPFTGQVDYLTFGGIYRNVSLRIVNSTHIDHIFVKPKNLLSSERSVEIAVVLDGLEDPADWVLKAQVKDDGQVVASGEAGVTGAECSVVFDLPETLELWDLDHPKRYTVSVQLEKDGRPLDGRELLYGFREAVFTDAEGFKLNGKTVKLRGINRHQSYPYVGIAVPRRGQRMDALRIKNYAKCNMVRTSHYPQSQDFLDCCDEIGLLVFEEITGWVGIGDDAWKKLALTNLEEMIVHHRNHASIVLWGVRINESKDDDAFYTETNRLAHALDGTRQTGGVRNFANSHLLEDVFTINDFRGGPLLKPNHPKYLVTEYAGHMMPTKVYDNVERLTDNALMHAEVVDAYYSSNVYAGGIAWCMHDYNTHPEFGSGDRMCHHGIFDTFRNPKPSSFVYRSQCDLEDEIVLEPVFIWSMGDWSAGSGLPTAVVCSNCDELRFFIGEDRVAVETPCREKFQHMPHPPFICEKLIGIWGEKWEELKIEGYVNGEKVAERRMSASSLDAQFYLEADENELVGDGIDMTLLRFGVLDEYGNRRPFAHGAVSLEIEGPGRIIGDNPFALVGGMGAVWIKSLPEAGTIKVRASHTFLGSKEEEIKAVDFSNGFIGSNGWAE